MNKDTYDRIIDYCTREGGISLQTERDYVLRNFIQSYFDSIKTFEETHHTPPLAEDIETIINSLLTPNTLANFAKTAKTDYSLLKTSIENDFKKNQRKNAFFWDLFINVSANFIYSIILALLFFLAKEQIKSWLMQLN